MCGIFPRSNLSAKPWVIENQAAGAFFWLTRARTLVLEGSRRQGSPGAAAVLPTYLMLKRTDYPVHRRFAAHQT